MSFGEKVVGSYLTMHELFDCIFGDTIMNYNLLMPVLLFLPSFSTPVEVVEHLLLSYRRFSQKPHDSSSTAVLMNILIIFRCWLRESFAHHDFDDDILVGICWMTIIALLHPACDS